MSRALEETQAEHRSPTSLHHGCSKGQVIPLAISKKMTLWDGLGPHMSYVFMEMSLGFQTGCSGHVSNLHCRFFLPMCRVQWSKMEAFTWH